MSILENIKMALISIFDNKLRSFLTMISIIIGIAAVIAIVSIGRGVSNNLVNGLLDMTNGSININYVPKGTEDDEDAYYSYVSYDEDIYTARQVELLRTEPLIKDVVVSNSTVADVSYLDNELPSNMVQTLDVNELSMFNERFQMVQGTMFSDYQFTQHVPVVLVHQNTAEKLFGTIEQAIGKELLVNSKIFTVGGVYSDKAAPLGMYYGSGMKTIYMPYNSWVAYKGYEEIQGISVVPVDNALLKETGQAVEQVLNNNKTLDGHYEVVNFDSMIRQVEEQLGMMTTFITLIAAISLLVGGIGVMNIMYVSVVERTHEIGLRKALGASGRQVLWQFLIESVTITSLGGLIGITLGLIGNMIGSALIGYSFNLYLDVILIGFGFAAAIGLLFGTLPAVKAAKMQPIDALRSL